MLRSIAAAVAAIALSTLLAPLVASPARAQAGVTATPATSATPANPANPVALPPGVTLGPSIGGLTEYQFANGLKAILIPDTSLDSITLNVTYLVGSRHEGYGEAGMAHLLEHMLYKGTPRFPEAKPALSARGAQFNGTTYYDRTNYFETLPATRENLAWAIDFEADRMVNAIIAKADLDSEMTVVRNEFESRDNNPGSVLLERIAASAYQWHNYGRSVIGSRSDIERVPVENLRDFYRHFYQPDNAVVVLSGKFDSSEALGLLAKHFGAIPQPTRKLRATYTLEPTQDGEREVILRRVGRIQLVNVLYHVPPGAHPDYPAMDLVTNILNTPASGRLHKALVVPGLAAGATGRDFQLREMGSVYFSANVPLGTAIEPARAALLATVEGFAKQPIADEELERARRDLLNEVETVLANSRSLNTTLTELIALGDWRLLFWYRDRLKAITRDEVQRAAVTYLKPQNRTLGLFIPTDRPDRAEIPAEPDLAKMLADYRGGESVAAGEAFDPTPLNIEARLIRRTLPGGIKLIMFPKKTRGEKVLASLTLRWGDEASKAERPLACSAAGSMLSRGTLSRNREAIRDELAKLRASVSVSTEGASLDTVRAGLPDTLKLVADMLRNPSFPADEFEQVKRQSLASLDSQRTEPGTLAALSIGRHLSPYARPHWLYQPTIDEREREVKALSLAEVKRCHAELVGASNAEFAIVGDFDPDAVTRQLSELFDNWRSPARYERIVQKFHDPAPLNQIIETPDKANAVYRAGMKLRLSDNDADFAPLVLGNYLFGQSSGSRLYRRIRETEGLSYGVGSSLSAGSDDAVGEFAISAIYAPQNRTRLETAMKEELGRVLSEGFTEQEVTEGRRAYIEARRVARTQDGATLARLASYVYLGRTFKWDIDFENRLASLTKEEIHAAMRRHLNTERLSIIRAGDFAAATRNAAQAGSRP